MPIHFTTTIPVLYATCVTRRYSFPLTLKITTLFCKKLADGCRLFMSNGVPQAAARLSASHVFTHDLVSGCFRQNSSKRDVPTIFIGMGSECTRCSRFGNKWGQEIFPVSHRFSGQWLRVALNGALLPLWRSKSTGYGQRVAPCPQGMVDRPVNRQCLCTPFLNKELEPPAVCLLQRLLRRSPKTGRRSPHRGSWSTLSGPSQRGHPGSLSAPASSNRSTS